ncbi:hypothetical protein SRHO_G00191660 [Serrasalmus rhombeus]
MARKKSKQAGAGQKEDPQQQQQQRSAAEKKADGAAAGGGDAGLDRPARTSQSPLILVLTCFSARQCSSSTVVTAACAEEQGHLKSW